MTKQIENKGYMHSPKLTLKDIRFKAVIAGALVDNLGTMFSMSLIIIALSSTGLTEPQVMERMMTMSGLLLALIIGLGWTTAGGYTAARMAKQNEVLHGALVAVVGIALAIIFRDKEIPMWFDIAGLVGMLPAAIAGALRAKKRAIKT